MSHRIDDVDLAREEMARFQKRLRLLETILKGSLKGLCLVRVQSVKSGSSRPGL